MGCCFGYEEPEGICSYCNKEECICKKTHCQSCGHNMRSVEFRMYYGLCKNCRYFKP